VVLAGAQHQVLGFRPPAIGKRQAVVTRRQRQGDLSARGKAATLRLGALQHVIHWNAGRIPDPQRGPIAGGARRRPGGWHRGSRRT